MWRSSPSRGPTTEPEAGNNECVRVDGDDEPAGRRAVRIGTRSAGVASGEAEATAWMSLPSLSTVICSVAFSSIGSDSGSGSKTVIECHSQHVLQRIVDRLIGDLRTPPSDRCPGSC